MVIDRAAAVAEAEAFTDLSDLDDEKSRELILMLLRHSEAPFSRAQMTPGHITCTGLVLSRDHSRIILVHHRRLGRWLLPGGHIEPGDATLWDAAAREVREETGVDVTPLGSRLAGLDVHGIPPKKAESYHLHHDLIFPFVAQCDGLQLSDESIGVAWCSEADFGRYELPGSIVRAFRRAVRFACGSVEISGQVRQSS